MKSLFTLLLLLVLFSLCSQGQTKYQITGVSVTEYGRTLQNPWVGGFNNPVFSTIDLNQDGLMDLFVYDKAAWKALSFINTGSVGHPNYTYAPQYDTMYPNILRDWAVVRDYNHDGIGDIFALTENSDICVLKGFRNGNVLSYQMVYPHLMYSYGAYLDHVWTFSDNMPVIQDIDGDGAIDILAPDINGGATLDWYRNVARDSGYIADSIVLVDQDDCWGRFIEDAGDCNVALAECKKDLPMDTTPTDLRHQGGACWGTHYVRGSNVTSVFIADIYCNTMKFLWNTGDSFNSNVTWVDTLFPSYDVPINMPLFPAVYGVDVDNDGFDDLLQAPFASNANVPSQSEDVNVVHYYHNNAGTDSLNTYHYEGDTLFNNGIVDVGTESHPVFFDYNGDSLMDIVIGNYGHFAAIGQSGISGLPGIAVSSLTLFKNVGTDTMPIFELADTDWNHLSAYNLLGLYPAFGDLDGDSLPDMLVGDLSGNVNFFKNRGTASQASYPIMDSAQWFGLNIGQDAAPFIYDVNGDGLPDLVIGSSGREASLIGGHIFYYWNFGTPTQPRFSQDSVNEFFGNIEVWDYHIGIVQGFATPIIRSENGSLVLYSGCEDGDILKYAINQDSLRSGTFTLLDSDVIGISPGFRSRSNVSIADINHDGKNDYLVGNIRGGLMLFSDTMWGKAPVLPNGISAVPADNNTLQVFPNPAKDKILCRLGVGAQQLVGARLYDLMGAMVGATVINCDENGITMSVSNLSEGIYIVQAIDQTGRTYQQKVSIVK